MDIVVTFPGKKVVKADYKGFEMLSDQAVTSGGDGSAPTPFDLFLVSIANCAATYVAYFCDNRGISTDKIRVVQRMERDPESHMIGKISIIVEIPPDFPQKYIKPMLHAVDLCAVKKHIVDPPRFEVSAATSG